MSFGAGFVIRDIKLSMQASLNEAEKALLMFLLHPAIYISYFTRELIKWAKHRCAVHCGLKWHAIIATAV